VVDPLNPKLLEALMTPKIRAEMKRVAENAKIREALRVEEETDPITGRINKPAQQEAGVELMSGTGITALDGIPEVRLQMEEVTENMLALDAIQAEGEKEMERAKQEGSRPRELLVSTEEPIIPETMAEILTKGTGPDSVDWLEGARETCERIVNNRGNDIRREMVRMIEIIVVQLALLQDRLTRLEEDADYSMEAELGPTEKGLGPEKERERT